MDQDIHGITEKGFPEYFHEDSAVELPESSGEVTSLQRLETSSVNSYGFNIFFAAQIFKGEFLLVSGIAKVSDWVSTIGNAHHNFFAGVFETEWDQGKIPVQSGCELC